jgi:uncharacterized protein involved in cysteine biosynthesis
MQDVFTALWNALKSLLQPPVLALVLWPMLLALVVWGGVAFLFWQDWTGALAGLIGQSGIRELLAKVGLHWVPGLAAALLAVLLLLPAVYVTALLITSIAAMPVMVGHVARRDFPALEKKRGGTLAGSLRNALVSVIVYLVLWLLTLPLWLTALWAPVAAVALNAYLNQRLFRYDALADHASKEEFRLFIEQNTGRLYLLGAVLALIQLLPVINLVAPVYTGLAFIHFGLAGLARMRKEAQGGSA